MDTHEAIYRVSGEEDIFSYARHNRLAHLRRCLDGGYDVESRDYGGNTVLIVGCQNGLKNVIKCALRRGGQLNTANDMGNTGLHFLVQYGYTELAESALPETTRPGLQLAARYLRTSPAESTWQPDRFETLN